MPNDISETFSDFDIAVVGLSGRFPLSKDLTDFYNNLLKGKDFLTRFTNEKLLLRGINSAVLEDPNYVKVGSILEDAFCFDNKLFGIPPSEAELLDPQRRIFLECVFDALFNAGLDPFQVTDVTGVYASTSTLNYLLFNLRHLINIEKPTQSLRAWIANDKDYIATYTSYKLNLKGPSIAIQCGCSSSLVAVSTACQSLLDHHCDLAIAGGVSLILPQDSGYFYDNASMASPDGYCRPFDKKASGTVFGSGAAVVVLKRLKEAISDKNPIHAVIKSFALNNDGQNKVAFAAPSVDGQVQVIQEALELADIPPSTIGYIETHGTGTALGDPIEIKALRTVYQGKVPTGTCPIGSIKANVGHLNAAAGITGLLKAILCIKFGKIPPTINYTEPNPECRLENSPFFVNTSVIDFPERYHLKRVAISSFGIGGTNAHVIIQEPPKSNPDAEATLNNYNFNRSTFYIAPVKSIMESESASETLTGKIFKSPLSNQVLFQSEFSLEKLPYLDDHKLYGEIIVSGATFLAMTLESAIRLNKHLPYFEIKNILFPSALMLSNTEHRDVQFAINQKENNKFRITSLPAHADEDDSYLLHCTGQVNSSDHYQRNFQLNLADLRSRLTEKLDTHRIFAALQHYNVELGPSHRWITNILRSDREVLCEMRALPEVKMVDEFHLYPGLIDSCFQVLAAIKFTEDSKAFVPFSIKSFRYHSDCRYRKLFAYGVLKPAKNIGAQKVVGDIFLVNEKGKLVAEIIELESRQASLEQLSQAQASQSRWFYEIQWQEKSLQESANKSQDESKQTLPAHWLVIQNGPPVQFVFQAQAAIRFTYLTIDKSDCGNPEHLKFSSPEQLCQHISDNQEHFEIIDGTVIFCSSLNEQKHYDNISDLKFDETAIVEEIFLQQQSSTGTWLDVVKALRELKCSSEKKLLTITMNSQTIHGRDSINPWQAPTWAMSQVLRQENPALSVFNLDVPNLTDMSMQQIFSEIVHLTTNGKKQEETHIAYQNGLRYVARLERSKTKFNPNISKMTGAVLITGGTGALGLVFAQHLLEKGVQKVFLMSRSGMNEACHQQINQLPETSQQQLEVIKGDVGNFTEVQDAIKHIKNGKDPLIGILHCAGILDDGMIQNQNFNRYWEVFRPKAIGAWNLHKATLNENLLFFVCFSSSASILGAMGQSTYAGANSFMDALCRKRYQQGKRALSVNWGAFLEVGMASQLRTIRRRHAMQGISSIPVKEGVTALLNAISADKPQLMVIPIKWEQLASSLQPAHILPLFRRVINMKAVKSSHSRTSWAVELARLGNDEKKAKLSQYIKGSIYQSLGLRAEDELLQFDQGFFDMGVDSLISVEIYEKIQLQLGLPLPSTVLFDYPNLNELCNYLLGELQKQETDTDLQISPPQFDEKEAFAILKNVLNNPNSPEAG